MMMSGLFVLRIYIGSGDVCVGCMFVQLILIKMEENNIFEHVLVHFSVWLHQQFFVMLCEHCVFVILLENIAYKMLTYSP